MDPPGETFASMTYPGLAEAESAGKYVLQYYQKNRDSIGTDQLKSHPRGSLIIHMIRGREGAVAVAAQKNANVPGIQILTKKLASELTLAVMSALTAAAEDDEESSPPKPKSTPPKKPSSKSPVKMAKKGDEPTKEPAQAG